MALSQIEVDFTFIDEDKGEQIEFSLKAAFTSTEAAQKLLHTLIAKISAVIEI
ncbi:MAG: hypothetical protein ACE3JP_05660 [Ectobacillus sp.]